MLEFLFRNGPTNTLAETPKLTVAKLSIKKHVELPEDVANRALE